MPAPVAPRASRLLLDLAAAVEATRDVHEADCLRADLAAQLVRSGHDAEGEAMLAELRARYRATPHERVTPWLNFAESTVDLQNGRGEEALIKMRRAHALSQAIGLPLTALAAASLASMYWNLQDADKAVGYASEALRVAVENDHRARCRASAVVAEILGMSRREADAGRWFVRARMHASLSGDHTALSVIGFNAAQTRLVVERQHFRLDGYRQNSGVSQLRRAVLYLGQRFYEVANCSTFRSGGQRFGSNRTIRATPGGGQVEFGTAPAPELAVGACLVLCALFIAGYGSRDGRPCPPLFLGKSAARRQGRDSQPIGTRVRNAR